MPQRENIGAIRLKDRTVSLWTQFIGSAPLQSFRRLPILKIKAQPVAPLGINVWRALNDQVCLVQAEAIAADVVSAQQIDPADRLIEIVSVVPVKRAVDGCAAKKIEQRAV